ncbi:MAG: class I SAM-dependent methyltransferase [Solirubrobacteraceae bacterium]|nr:class I SAM-dependent methyltransferase [Solirubrobacteraceae bacterium]
MTQQTTSAAEHERLAGVASWFSSHEGMNGWISVAGFNELRPWFTGTSCLELGPADGVITAQLIECFDRLHAVEGSAEFADQLRDRYADRPGFSVDAALFEDFRTDVTFDTIFANHVLEHVIDPVAVLQSAREWIAPGGRLIVGVPNALSIHRRVAVHMGLLGSPYELNETDHRLGHRRVYDLDTLRADVEAAGWRVEATGGTLLKVVSNGQAEQWFDESMLQGFLAVGREMPEACAEVYIVAQAD